MVGVVPKLQDATVGLIADDGETATVDLSTPEAVIRQAQETDEEGTPHF